MRRIAPVINTLIALLGFAALRTDPERSQWLRRLAFRIGLIVLVPSFIVMRVGAEWIVSKEYPGKTPDVYTWTFHRPIGTYVKALRNAGLLVDALEEWPSHKSSEPGPRAAAENTARKEIPMFLAMRVVKIPPAADADTKDSSDNDTSVSTAGGD